VRVNEFTFTWPVVLLAAVVVLLIGALIAWGVRTLEGRNRSESRAERIQQAVGDAIARDPALTGAAVLPVATFPLEGPPTLELTGSVPSAEARERALRAAQRELARVRPGMQVIDRLAIVPSLADRRRA
jgi:hypothetical protein